MVFPCFFISFKQLFDSGRDVELTLPDESKVTLTIKRFLCLHFEISLLKIASTSLVNVENSFTLTFCENSFSVFISFRRATSNFGVLSSKLQEPLQAFKGKYFRSRFLIFSFLIFFR